VSRRFRAALLGWLVCVGCGSDSPLGPSQADVARSGPAGAGGEKAPKDRGDAAAASAAPVLYDARDRAKLPPGVERQPKLAPEIEKLLDATLAPTGEDSGDDCQGEQEPTLRVLASAAGSFTAPVAKQTAYIVARAACGADDAEAIRATHLVVVEGGKAVVQTPGQEGASGEPLAFQGIEIRAVADVDQDGVNELLVTSSDGPQESARLYAVKGGELKTLKEFRAVYVNGCGEGSQGQARAQVIHYVVGAKDSAARFSTEQYRAPCPASGAPAPSDFQPVKSPAAPTASPSASAEPSTKPS
jgi:hypothetical protein